MSRDARLLAMKREVRTPADLSRLVVELARTGKLGMNVRWRPPVMVKVRRRLPGRDDMADCTHKHPWKTGEEQRVSFGFGRSFTELNGAWWGPAIGYLGSPRICPVTDRGVPRLGTRYSFAFDSLPALFDYLSAHVTEWKIRG